MPSVHGSLRVRSQGSHHSFLTHGGRVALVIATSGHFLGAAGSIRVSRDSLLYRKRVQLFSVRTPLAELVAQLNQFRRNPPLGLCEPDHLAG